MRPYQAVDGIGTKEKSPAHAIIIVDGMHDMNSVADAAQIALRRTGFFQNFHVFPLGVGRFDLKPPTDQLTGPTHNGRLLKIFQYVAFPVHENTAIPHASNQSHALPTISESANVTFTALLGAGRTCE
jgi:hypothetical protein